MTENPKDPLSPPVMDEETLSQWGLFKRSLMTA